MQCKSCGEEMSVGFASVRLEGSTLNLDWNQGELVIGKLGAKGAEDRPARPILAWACEACGLVSLGLDREHDKEC